MQVHHRNNLLPGWPPAVPAGARDCPALTVPVAISGGLGRAVDRPMKAMLPPRTRRPGKKVVVTPGGLVRDQ